MKLLFLTEFFPSNDRLIFTGGVEARTYYVARQAKKNFSVTIIASPFKSAPATALSIFPRILFLIISFIKVLFADFDLIEASNVVTYLPAFLAAKIRRKPVVIWVPDILSRSWFEFGYLVGIFGFLIEKLYLSLPWDGVIALSETTKTKLLAAGIRAEIISVVKAGIDPKEFPNSLGRRHQPIRLICVARLVKTKKIDQLIQAVVRHNLPVKLTVVGFGPQESRLKKLAKGKVAFLKNLQRADLIKLLSQSDLFCLPSVVEGFGIATIEAMACGIPAVLADIPINREITKAGRGTVFFEPGNITDLAKQIKNLIDSQSLYHQKQTEALQLAKTYTWDKVYQQTKKFYESCLHH